MILALGATLFVHGHKTSIHGPWWLLKHLPVLRYAIPVRFAVFYVLPAALMVALLLSRWSLRQPAGIAAWGLTAVAVAFIVPNVGSSSFDTRIADPPFFASGAYKAYIHPSDNVLTIPAWGPNERWQANTGLSLQPLRRLRGQPVPAVVHPLSGVEHVPDREADTGLRGAAAAVRRRQAGHRGRRRPERPGAVEKLFGSLGVRPVSTGGVLVYRLRPTP